MDAGESKTFTVHFPEDYAAEEFRNADVEYSATVKEIRKKVLPELDDEFAKDLGEFDSLSALRERVRTDMTAEAEDHARRHTRTELLKQLAQRVTFELPDVAGGERDGPPAEGVRPPADAAACRSPAGRDRLGAIS